MHAIIDTERRQRNAQENEIRQNRHKMHETAFTEARDQRLVGKITDEGRQRGTALDATVFMNRLRKLNPDLVMEKNPHQEGFAALYLNVGESRIYLFPCQDGSMPEWSVFDTREVRVPVLGTTAWKKTLIPGAEIRRGWRTILARLVQKRIVSQEAVEREFGVGNRRSWAALLGKTSEHPEI